VLLLGLDAWLKLGLPGVALSRCCSAAEAASRGVPGRAPWWPAAAAACASARAKKLPSPP
jgi:hypothetical protein